MTELDDATLERKKVRATLATRALIVGAIAVTILFGAAMLKVTLQGNDISARIRAQQIVGTQRAKDTQQIAVDAARSANRVEECTTAGNKCYDDQQRQAAKFLASISQSQQGVSQTTAAAGAYCANLPGLKDYDTLLKCIQKVLNQP